MRDSGNGNRPSSTARPSSSPSSPLPPPPLFSASFVVPPTPGWVRSSCWLLPPAAVTSSFPPLPSPPLPSTGSLSSLWPTVLYLLTQLKKQSVERPRPAFYRCRCRGPAAHARPCRETAGIRFLRESATLPRPQKGLSMSFESSESDWC